MELSLAMAFSWQSPCSLGTGYVRVSSLELCDSFEKPQFLQPTATQCCPRLDPCHVLLLYFLRARHSLAAGCLGRSSAGTSICERLHAFTLHCLEAVPLQALLRA